MGDTGKVTLYIDGSEDAKALKDDLTKLGYKISVVRIARGGPSAFLPGSLVCGYSVIRSHFGLQ